MKTIAKFLKWFFEHESEWLLKKLTAKQKTVEHAYWLGAIAR